ncbi:alpha/beta-hydrolase [Rhypophila sp. PSN 637]
MTFRTLATIALTMFVVFNDVLAVTPSPGCGQNQASGTVSSTTTVNGKRRSYITNLPVNYNSSNPYRLIFMFHGWGNSASAVANGQQGFLPFMGLPPLANREGDPIGAISVAPEGLNSAWANSGGEDITFVDQMIKEIESRFCIDQSLRFSTGFSYGASMSYAIACARAKQFRAVAIISGAKLSGCDDGGRRDPIAFYGQHGSSDGTIPIASGKQLRDTFVANNGCTKQTVVDAAAGSGALVKTQYQGCTKGFPVTWVSFDGGHTSTPTTRGAAKSFTPDETWVFFRQFT